MKIISYACEPLRWYPASVASNKNAAAVALGKLGGKARARALSPEERSRQASKAARKRTRSMSSAERTELARKAARARWRKKQ